VGRPQELALLECAPAGPYPGQETVDNVLNAPSCLPWILVNGQFHHPSDMQCCTANGNQGFYYAWMRSSKVPATRLPSTCFSTASPLAETLESYLPYEGKWSSTTEGAQPPGAHPGLGRLDEGARLRQTVTPSSPPGTALCRLFDLPLTAEIRFEFPITEETVSMMIPGHELQQYRGVAKGTYQFKGSTCIGVVEDDEHLGSEYNW